LSGAGETVAESYGVLLLRDIQTLFLKHGERLHSTEIVRQLSEMEERPWPEYRRDKPITVRQLASILRRFEIGPKQLRIEGEKTRGYEAEDFRDAWERYLPPGDRVQAVQDSKIGAYRTPEPVHDGACVPDRVSRNLIEINNVPPVPNEHPPPKPHVQKDGPNVYRL
jgi:hypothetical protein